MSREKQISNCKNCNSHEEKKIKEMAKDLCDIIVWTDLDGEPLIDAEQTCTALYDIGYRKQSEGEWLVGGKCTACNEYSHIRTKYCGNCGAKMKGGGEE